MRHVRPLLTLVLLAVLLLTAASPALGESVDVAVARDTVRVWVNYGPGRGPEVHAALANANAT